MNKYKIVVIGGDGVGPELIIEAIRLLKECNIDLSITYADAGYGAYKKYGTSLPEETIKLCKKSDSILFGAVTTPPNIKD